MRDAEDFDILFSDRCQSQVMRACCTVLYCTVFWHRNTTPVEQ